MASPGADRGTRSLLGPQASQACLVLGALAIVAYYVLHGVAQDIVYDAIRLGAAAAIFAGARRRRPDASAWYLIGLAQLLFSLGDLTWDFYKHVQHADPFPSWADVFYLAAYPALAVSVVLQVRRVRPGSDREAVTDAAIVGIGIGVVVWVLLMQPYAHDPELSLAERAISLAYPLMDVALLTMGMRLVFARRGRSRGSALWDLGLLSLLVADIAFLATELAGTYHDGTAIDAAFLLSGVFWAASAWHGSSAAAAATEPVGSTAGTTRERVAVLFGAALIGPLLIAAQGVRGVHVDVAVTLGGSVALVSLALLRMTRRSPAPRIRNLALVAAGAGAILTLALTTISALRVTYASSDLRAAVETAQALIAFLVANLLYLRFRETRRWADLLLVYGIGLLGAANVFFVVTLSLGRQPASTVFQTWAPLLIRMIGAAAVVWAAWSRLGTVRASRVVARMVTAYVVSLALVAGVVLALQDRLPVGVARASRVIRGGRPSVVGHPVLLGAQLFLMVMFWLAAGGFVHRSKDDPGPLTAALAVGLILAGFSRLSFSLYPSLYTDIVHTGDILRLSGYVVFLVGAEREIHRYWEGLAHVAVSEERERTARELHDGLVQELSFIRSQTAGLASSGSSPALLRQVALAADRALEESRRAVRVFSDDTAEDVCGALQRAAEDIAVRSGVHIRVDTKASFRHRSHVVAELSRIVREACSNAVRHGGASEIVLRVEPWEAGRLRVTVSDDGAGFDPDVAARDGFGIRSMRERAVALGGALRLVSRDGQGTTVEVVVPMA